MILNLIVIFLKIFLELLYWAIFIKILLSWFAQGRNSFGIWLEQIVSPLLVPFRWARIGMFDLSPLFALLALSLLQANIEFLIVKIANFLTHIFS